MKKLVLVLVLFLIIGCKFNQVKASDKITNKDFFGNYIKNNLIIDSVFLCASRFNIDPELIIAIIYFESKFDETATNGSNENGSIDRGLMQLNNFTFTNLTVEQFYNIEVNIFTGTKHLKELLDKYNNNEILAVCAYNGGEWRCDNEKIKLTVIEYANKVLKYKAFLKNKYLEFVK